MSSNTPDLVEVIEGMISSSRQTMFGGWLPGRIETYDATKNKAAVQILLLETTTLEGGDTKKEPIAIIHEVPVLTFADHDGLRVELDLQKGDTVMVCFAARDVDRWKQQGGLIDPGTDRDHDFNDAVAIPMLFDFAHIKRPTAKIKFTSTTIQAGGNLGLALLSELQALRTAFLAHVHPVPGVVVGAGATTSSVTATVVTAPTGTQVLKGG